MTRFLLIVCVAGALGCGNRPGGKKGPLAERIPCSTDCPSGTAVASYTSEEIAVSDAFVIISGECETLCEPIAPCVWPNVPTVVATDEGSAFSCGPLQNFSHLPPAAEIDFSWAGFTGLPDPVQLTGGLGGPPDWTAAGDVDADGDDDAIFGSGSALVVARSDGAGGFALVPAQDFTDPIHEVRAGLFDGDGFADLVVRTTGLDGSQRLRLLSGVGDGSFAAGPDLLVLAALARGPQIADLDGDGNLDIAAQGAAAGGMLILWGNGDGSFTPPQILSGSCGLCNANFQLMRTTASGRVDIVHEQTAWINDGGRSFTEAGQALAAVAFPDALHVGAADLNLDGLDDLVFASFGQAGFSLAPDHQPDFFQTACVYEDLLLSIGDIDGDGTLDATFGSGGCGAQFFVLGTAEGPRMIELPGSEGTPVVGDFGTVRAVAVLP